MPQFSAVWWHHLDDKDKRFYHADDAADDEVCDYSADFSDTYDGPYKTAGWLLFNGVVDNEDKVESDGGLDDNVCSNTLDDPDKWMVLPPPSVCHYFFKRTFLCGISSSYLGFFRLFSPF